ncbi:MAG: archaellin/type IV pilin N-terminal domain-containing protein [Nanoarchaeota archaeon]
MFNSKKGVSEVITAVLMIVLVVAAISILGVVIIGLVRDNSENLGAETNCLSNSFALSIEGAAWNQSASGGGVATVKAKVKRTSGDSNLTTIALFANGEKLTISPTNAPNLGEVITYTSTPISLTNRDIIPGKNLEVSAVMGGKTCPISDTEAITINASVIPWN